MVGNVVLTPPPPPAKVPPPPSPKMFAFFTHGYFQQAYVHISEAIITD